LRCWKKLIQSAIDIRARAYAPYSDYPIGAALLVESGEIFTGVNVENAAYPITMSAARVVAFQAVSSGEKNFKMIAVMTDNGGSSCGSCRQVLAEFGLDTVVLIADHEGNLMDRTTVSDLLPDAFTPQDLAR